MLEVRILGPIEVKLGGRPVPSGRPQQQLIVGILALEVNRLVSVDRLVDLLWDSEAPARARPVIRSRISEFRAALWRVGGDDARAALVRSGDGYMLSTEPRRVDAHQFQACLSAASGGSTDVEACRALREALDLWRGPVLGGQVPPHARPMLTTRLESARLTAAEELLDRELQRGHHRQIADEALALIMAHPGRERLACLAMVALQMAGRTSDAIYAYHRCQRWLSAELGIRPGEELQRMYLDLLNGRRTALAV